MANVNPEGEDTARLVPKKRTSIAVQDEPIPLTFSEEVEEFVWRLPLALKIAKCSKSYENMVMYNRPSIQGVVQRLLNEACNRVIISGPPGVGKSTVAWLTALKYAKSNSEVCWVHVRTGHYYQLNPVTMQITQSAGSLYNPSPDPLPRAPIFILDGATKDRTHVDKLRALVEPRVETPSLVIIVSSVQSDYAGDFQDYEQIDMPGWTVDEYTKAVSHDPVFKQVLPKLLFPGEVAPEAGFSMQEREDLIMRKFYIAGYCCRWMFDRSVEDARADIAKALSEVTDYEALKSMMYGIRSKNAKNRLIMLDPDQANRSRFTSAFVAQELAKFCRSDMPALHSLVFTYGNTAMQGHALEIDFMDAVGRGRPGADDLLQDCIKYIVDPPSSPQTWDAAAQKAPRQFVKGFDNSFKRDAFGKKGDCVEFYHDTLDRATPIRSIVPGTWMYAEVVNQGGFDGAQLCLRDPNDPESLYLRFVQLTVQLNHPIKVYFMRSFQEDFNKRRTAVGMCPVSPTFEVVVMLPMDLAQDAAPPWEWVVIGDQRTGTRYGPCELNTFIRRVAGYTLRK